LKASDSRIGLDQIFSTFESFDAIARGDFDSVAEQAFFNVGSISDVEERWAQIQKEND